MKTLTLDDLSREELLAWIKLRFPWLEPSQATLLSIRHATLRRAAADLSLRYVDAVQAEERALRAWLDASLGSRARNAAERVYLDLKDVADKARKRSKKAERAADACWAALEAEWERGR